MVVDIQLEKRLNSIRKNYPDALVDAVEVIEVNGKKLYGRKQIAEILDLSDRRVREYSEAGLPKSDYSLKSYTLYDLREVVDWVLLNIKTSISKRKKERDADFDDTEVDPDANDWRGRKEKADAEKTEEQAKIERLKRQQLEGSLVDKDDIDKAMTETGAVYLSDYRDDLKLLPVALANKSADEIAKFLDKHYESRVQNMWRLANTSIQIEEITIFDKLKEFLEDEDEISSSN